MPTFICRRCSKTYEKMTPEGFCTNQPDCEYGSGWLSEIKDAQTGAEPASTPSAIRFDNEVGLCVLMMDGSLSMGEPAFPQTGYPGTKYRLVSMNAAGGIWSLRNMTHAENAYIALCVFGGKPELVWIKSVKEIVAEYATQEAFANYIHDVLQKQTPEPKVTNIATAVKLAYDIYRAYLAGNLGPFGGISDFRPLIHKVVKQSAAGEAFIDIPNSRVLIYTDGEHNVVDAVRNFFADEAQSVLLSAFIGEEGSPGVGPMQRIANECPRHSPAKGFFLIDSPECIQTLKGLFRMASGASGFCPVCLMMERAPETGPAPGRASNLGPPRRQAARQDKMPEASHNPGRPALLFAEVSTSCGPRKGPGGDPGDEEVELGEDSGGALFLDGDSAIVWVADGTSQTSKCGPFSSRILAQDLGKAFTMRAVLGRHALDPSGWNVSFLADCLRGTIRDVLQEWTEMLAPESPVAGMVADRIAAMRVPPAAEATRFLEFSTTFSAAGLNRNGQWQAASIGDAYLILNESGRTRFSALERGQITFRMRITDRHPTLGQHVPPIQQFDGSAANLICLSSDGTRETVQFLYETLHDDREFTLDQLPALKKKISRIKPRSQDDKTLALLGRIYPD